MAVSKISSSTPLVLLGQQTGVTIIPAQTPLTRLNYFDGKFLRAQDLQAEQNYLRQLTQLSNQANGYGVVNGFNVTLGGGDQLTLGAGLAIDPRGRVLLLGQEQSLSVTELLEKSRNLIRLLQSATLNATGGFAECSVATEAPTTNAAAGRDWYLLVLAHAEALCGEEDVYGKLCEEACVTSTDRPYRLEGVVLRALPLLLTTPLATSAAVQLDRTHLRSLIASAYYADEAKRVGSLISGAGLKSEAWCFGALGATGNEVPVGILVRDGNSTLFVDEWTARRELVETSPRRYWQWRMSMRPWDVFQAQIDQFQCQLHARLGGGVDTTPDDPCAEAKRLVEEAATHIKVLASYYKQTTSKLQKLSKAARDKVLEDTPEFAQAGDQYAAFEARLLQATQAFQLLPQDKLLIRSGIVETPSAGYLPVVPGNTITVNQQVRRLMGEGVDLRFCVVRPDYIPHALEEAQHMERISLLKGLDNPNEKERVDVLVPNGRIAPDHSATGRYYEMRLNLLPANLELLAFAMQFALEGQAKDAAARAAAPSDTRALSALQKYVLLLTATAEGKNSQTLEFSGAAFADASEQGALSFYYAGITRPTSLLGTKPPVATPAPVPETPIGGLRINTNFGSPASADMLKEAVMSRVLRLDTNLTANLQRDIEARAAVWLATEIAQDPTTVARGGAVAVKAECILEFTLELEVKPAPENTLRLLDSAGATLAPAAAAINTDAAAAATASRSVAKVVRLGFVGEFSVDDVATRAGANELREARGTLSGELSVSVRSGVTTTSGDQETFSIYLSEPVSIQRSVAANGPLFKILASDWSILKPLVGDIEVEREWKSAQKAEALGLIHFKAPQSGATGLARDVAANANFTITLKDTVRQAFRAWQTVNPQVLEPRHPAHEDAIRALRAIGAGLGSPKFADLAAARLFPAPKPTDTGLNVLATLDWVMFHRRREKTCQQDRPTSPVETRQYAVYHLQLKGDQTLAEVRKLLERTAANAKLPALDFVQLVEFGAGIHAVTSSHPQLQASWRQDVGAAAGKIAGGFIASQGVAAAEGARLAQERIESLADVLASVTPEVTGADYQVLARVPDSLGAAGNDGVIIVATRAAAVVTAIDHAVIAVEDQASLQRFVAAAQAGNLATTIATDKLARNLGIVKFDGGVADAASLQRVAGAWDALDFKPLSGAAVFGKSTDPAGVELLAQSNAVLVALRNPPGAQFVGTTETLTSPVITIVAGTVDNRNVLFVYGAVQRVTSGSGVTRVHLLDASSPQSTGNFRNDVPQGDALKNFVTQLTPNRPVIGITLALVSGLPDAHATVRIKTAVDQLRRFSGQVGAPAERTEALSGPDRTAITRLGRNPADFAEIYFFESDN